MKRREQRFSTVFNVRTSKEIETTGFFENPDSGHTGQPLWYVSGRQVGRSHQRRIAEKDASVTVNVNNTNPWRAGWLEKCRDFLRFALWTCIAINGGMLGVFSVAFTYAFLRHAWGWCNRVLFSRPW